MSKYDDDSKETKGKITLLKLDVKKEGKSGKSFRAHVLKIEDEEGEEHKFVVSVKAPPAKFIEKLDKGQQVTVKEADGKFGMQVVAVFSNDGRGKGKGGYAKTNTRKESDPTGAIQGNTRSNAALLVANGIVKPESDSDKDVAAALAKAAQILLIAGIKQDAMVVQSRKPKDEDEDDDSDDSDEDSDESEKDEESEDEDEDLPKKKKRKKEESPY